MDSHKTNYLRVLKYLLIPINLIFLIVLLLNFVGILPAAFKIIYFFYFALIVDTVFLALKINKIPEDEKAHSKIVYYAKYLFLLSLVIITLNQFLDRQIVNDYMNYLVGFSIATGFLTFYSLRIKISKGIETEREKNNFAETRRKDEFPCKFPRINKVWGLRRIVKWMYKEGWWYVAGLAIAILVSSFFMLPGLGSFLTVDEPRWFDAGLGQKNYPINYDQTFESSFIDSTYARSEAYWDSYLSGNLQSTLNNGNPSATINFLHLPAYMIKGNTSFGHYLTINRLTIIIHNLILLIVLYTLLKRLFSKNQALLGFFMISLFPSFIGYSRIVNHDSVQGIYIAIFLLSLMAALFYKEKKYYILTGIFLALSVLTQYKSIFLIPLMFLMVPAIDITNRKHKIYQTFINNIHIIIISLIATSVIILPATLFYPQILSTYFLFYPKPLIILADTISIALFVIYSGTNHKIQLSYNVIRIAAILIFVTLVLLFLYLNFQSVDLLTKGVYTYPAKSQLSAMLGTFLVFFYFQPVIYLALLASSMIFIMYRPKLNISFSLTLLFFVLLVLATISSYDYADRGGGGFMSLDSRYIYVFFPILIIGIISNDLFKILPKKVFVAVLIALLVSSTYANFQYKPFYIHYGNEFLPRGYLSTKTTWALDTSETANYINEHFANITVYSPRGRLEPFLNEDIKLLSWHSEFWLENPDYMVIEWEKDHKYAEIFDYYRENKTPIWKIEKNGAIYTGIYKFDPNIDYSLFNAR